MSGKMLLRKTCSIYASDLHFATMIFPFVSKEVKRNTTIRTILEKDEQENIEKIIKNIGLNSDVKEKIKNIDWKESNINKIRKSFRLLEGDIKNENDVDIIVVGSNVFIQKINKAIDLWTKNNIEKLENSKIKLNIINCFSFEENNEIDRILDVHDYILKTAGIEELINREDLLKAN